MYCTAHFKTGLSQCYHTTIKSREDEVREFLTGNDRKMFKLLLKKANVFDISFVEEQVNSFNNFICSKESKIIIEYTYSNDPSKSFVWEILNTY